jgi:hypothetical protein
VQARALRRAQLPASVGKTWSDSEEQQLRQEYQNEMALTDIEREKQCGYTFLVTGFRFGARRGDNGPPVSSRCAKPPGKPQPDAAEAPTDAMPQGVAEAAAG